MAVGCEVCLATSVEDEVSRWVWLNLGLDDDNHPHYAISVLVSIPAARRLSCAPFHFYFLSHFTFLWSKP